LIRSIASSFKFGGDIEAAMGPRSIGAQKILTANYISFAKAKELYAGPEFEGSGVTVRDDLNKAYYGRDVRPVEIIVRTLVENPHSAELREALKKEVPSR
jgi:lipid-binding SYLF domain-containing protein